MGRDKRLEHHPKIRWQRFDRIERLPDPLIGEQLEDSPLVGSYFGSRIAQCASGTQSFDPLPGLLGGLT